MRSSNVILIGMPGSGKSTIGPMLARQLGLDFLDGDDVTRASQGISQQAVIDADGYLALRRVEEADMLALRLRDQVLATSGSVVYSAAAMRHLGSLGVIVLLHVDLPVLRARLHDFETRGITMRPGQSLEDLFAERAPLYLEYADVVVDCTDLTREEVCARIREALQRVRGEAE